MTNLTLATPVKWLVWRELTLTWRRRSEATGMVLFFLMVVSLFPLGVGSGPDLLRRLAPAIVWIAALLASLLSLHRLFVDDAADGTLEQLLLTPYPAALMVLTKVLAQWAVSIGPLLLSTPLVAVQLGLPQHATRVVALSLLLGTPTIMLIGSVGAALTLGLRGAATLTSLLVLPLYIPTLVLGAGAVETALTGGSVSAHVRLLTALLIVALMGAPWAAAAALRVSLE